MKENPEKPVYTKIAQDVAVRIASGSLKEGIRIAGRSVLAGEYKVSPETVRRAMSILEQEGILEICEGKGIFIRSAQNAARYIEQIKKSDDLFDFKENLEGLLRRKREIEDRIMETISRIIDYNERFKNLNTIYPVEFEVPENSPADGKRIGDLRFWQSTGATIVGIKKNGVVTLSPGPFAVITEGDVILAVGGNDIADSVRRFLQSGDKAD